MARAGTGHDGTASARRSQKMADQMVAAAGAGRPWQPCRQEPHPPIIGSTVVGWQRTLSRDDHLVPAAAIVDAYRRLGSTARGQPASTERPILALAHAVVQGDLDLSDTRADVGLAFTDCRLDALALERAEVRSLSLEQCLVAGGVHAREARVARNVVVEGSRVEEIDLDDARIDGPVRVGAGSEVTGTFMSRSAVVKGPFLCQEARLGGRDGSALEAEGAKVAGAFSFTGARSNGTISLEGAVIDGGLDCERAVLDGAGGPALVADRAKIGGGAKLTPSEARGGVTLAHARVGGTVSCAGALSATHAGGDALSMEGAIIRGDVFLEDLRATGTVHFIGVEIHGEAHINDTVLDGVGSWALNADNIHVTEVMWLGPALESRGTVRLCGARLAGQLACKSATLLQGTVLRDGPTSTVLDLSCARVDRLFTWVDVNAQGLVDLRLAHVAVLHGTPPGCDARQSRRWRWGWEGKASRRASAAGRDGMTYRLDGFTYDQVTAVNDPNSPWAGDGPMWRRLVTWLDGEVSDSFQPYSQLAKVYRAAGHDTEAAHVLFHGHKKRANWVRKPLWLVGYGYRQRYALLAAVALLALTWGLLEWQRDEFVPTDTVVASGDAAVASAGAAVARATAATPQVLPPEAVAERCHERDVHYPCLYTSAYSFETVVPLVSLGQREAWQPDLEAAPSWIKWFLWGTTVAGWAIAVLAVASFTGAVRKE